jgi:hypothetical protein
MKWFWIIAITFAFLVWSQGPSIILLQSAPRFGDSINFTEVYPKEATRKIGQRQRVQPATQVDCYQNGTHVYSQVTGAVSETQNGDGTVTGITGFLTLGGTRNELSWTGGAASCSAILYYFTTDSSKQLYFHLLAQISFQISE